MEDKRTIILNLAAQGMNSSQIARETGISPGSVYYYMHPEKRRKQRSLSTIKILTQLLAGMPIGRNAGAAGTGQDQNRSTDATTLRSPNTAEDVMLRTAIDMCAGGG